MSDIQEEQKRLYKRAEENDNSFIKIEDNFIIDDKKIKEIYGGDYKKALVEVGKNERKYILKCYLLEQKINKQKEVLDKIKETLKNAPNKEDDYDYINLKYEIYKLLEEIE